MKVWVATARPPVLHRHGAWATTRFVGLTWLDDSWQPRWCDTFQLPRTAEQSCLRSWMDIFRMPGERRSQGAHTPNVDAGMAKHLRCRSRSSTPETRMVQWQKI